MPRIYARPAIPGLRLSHYWQSLRVYFSCKSLETERSIEPENRGVVSHGLDTTRKHLGALLFPVNTGKTNMVLSSRTVSTSDGHVINNLVPIRCMTLASEMERKYWHSK